MLLKDYIIPGKPTIIKINDYNTCDLLISQTKQSNVFNNTQAFYHIITPENKNSGYKKEEFESIRHLLSLHQSNTYHVIIIKYADTISESLGNSLLLLLETLSPTIAIILITSNLKTLLPTIISRSIVFNVHDAIQHNQQLGELIQLVTNTNTSINTFDVFLQTNDIPLDTVPLFWELLLRTMTINHYQSEYIEKIKNIKKNMKLITSQTLYNNMIRLIFMILHD